MKIAYKKDLNKITYDQNKWTQSPCIFVNTVQIFITDKCNKRCKGCFNDNRLGTANMPIETYQKTVTQYKNHVKKIILMGGEPLMHPNIKDMIAFNQSNNLRTTIYTNGSYINTLKGIDFSNVTVRIGVLGLYHGEKKLIDVPKIDIPLEITYMLRKDNVSELFDTIKYAESSFNCKKIMVSSIRNISNSGDYWLDGEGDLSHDEYFDIAQDFVTNYKGNLDEIQVSVRGHMEVDNGDHNQCRFVNIFPNGDKIICPFDICKNLTEEKDFLFPDRQCNKNHKCLLQKVILERIGK